MPEKNYKNTINMYTNPFSDMNEIYHFETNFSMPLYNLMVLYLVTQILKFLTISNN